MAAGLAGLFLEAHPEPEKARALLDAARTDWVRTVAEKLVAKSHYYDVARELAALMLGA